MTDETNGTTLWGLEDQNPLEVIDPTGQFWAPFWSRDGKRLALVDYTNWTLSTYEVQPDGLVQLPALRTVALPAQGFFGTDALLWSGDGSRLLLTERDEGEPGFQVIGAASSALDGTVIVPDQTCTPQDWAPTDRVLLSCGGLYPKIVTTPANGDGTTDLRTILQSNCPPLFIPPYEPAWFPCDTPFMSIWPTFSPTGSHVAFWRHHLESFSENPDTLIGTTELAYAPDVDGAAAVALTSDPFIYDSTMRAVLEWR
jgi:Tol biopolymer transport system component